MNHTLSIMYISLRVRVRGERDRHWQVSSLRGNCERKEQHDAPAAAQLALVLYIHKECGYGRCNDFDRYCCYYIMILYPASRKLGENRCWGATQQKLLSGTEAESFVYSLVNQARLAC